MTDRLPPVLLEKALIWYARHFPVHRGKLRLIDTLWRTAAGDSGPRRMAELIHGNYRVPCDLNETLQRQFYFFGTYFLEQPLLECWQKLAREARVVFDVGANAGIYSLAALSSNPDATVYAFEPTPEIAARLRAAADLNGLDQLNVHEAAVMAEPGYAMLIRCRGADGANDGMNFIKLQSESGERVRTESLDTFCRARAIGKIDLMKIDVQGQEGSVLRGATELLREGRIGVILMELNWWAEADPRCPAAESVKLLESSGFRFSKPGAELRWQRSGNWLRQMSDVLAQRVEA